MEIIEHVAELTLKNGIANSLDGKVGAAIEDLGDVN